MGDLFFFGDTHGEFQHVIDAVKSHRPEAIIFLGDLQARQPLEIELEEILGLTEVWFIHGNHDTDSDADYDHLFSSELAEQNLHGRVVEIGGYRIAGLGGVFRGQVWMPPNDPKFDSQEDYTRQGGKGNLWRGGLTRKHRSTIFPIDYASLASQKADILVTHEAPSCHPHGIAAIDHLTRFMNVEWSFHGHHHDNRDYQKSWKSLGFNACGVGLHGIARFDGSSIYTLCPEKFAAS